jgi:hypothetical protein
MDASLVWIAAISTGLGCAVAIYFAYHRRPQADWEMKRWAYAFTSIAFVCSVSWASLAFVALPNTPQNEAIVLMGVPLIGLGTAAHFAAYLPCLVAGVVPCLVILSVAVSKIHLVWAPGFLLLSAAILYFGKAHNRAIRDSISQRIAIEPISVLGLLQTVRRLLAR